ncbi:MAG: hypothetical protein IJV56_08190, partial [Neisseriaceae bacterium]|nr:hypothetical protein [Neisseriaceae bacterium]
MADEDKQTGNNSTYYHRGNAGGEDAKLDTTNPKKPIGEDGVLNPEGGKKIVEGAENLPYGIGTFVHVGETVYYISKGDNDEAAKHLAQAGVSVLVPSSGNKFVDYGTGQVVSLGVDQAFEMQQNNNQDSQETDKPSVYDTAKDAWDKYTGEHDKRENEKLKQESDYKNQLDYDLRQEAYRLEKDGYNPEYDLLKQQAEREKYQPSDEANQAYQKKLIEINKQNFKTPEEKENAMAKAFGDYRDGKFEPSYKDDQLKKDTPNLDNPSKDKPQLDKDDNSDDGKSFFEDPAGWLKEHWKKWFGDDNNSEQEEWSDEDGGLPPGTVDDEGTPIEKDDDSQGQDTETPNGQPESPNGKGENEPNSESDPNGKGTPIQLPNAGGGHSAGLGGGKGAGTMGAGNPSSPVSDPLLIALNTGNNRSDIKIVSHDEENSSKMLDTNQDGI